MERAQQYVSFLNAIGAGRWSAGGVESGSWMADHGRSLEAARRAATAAVEQVLQPFVAEAEEALRVATAERDRIAKAGRLG